MFHEEKKKVELSVDQFLCYYINGECNQMKPFNMFEMKKKKKYPMSGEKTMDEHMLC